jgi:hypothetical protein
MRPLVIDTPCTSPCTKGVHPYGDLVSNTAGERGHYFPGPTAHQIFVAIIDVSVVGICGSVAQCKQREDFVSNARPLDGQSKGSYSSIHHDMPTNALQMLAM